MLHQSDPNTIRIALDLGGVESIDYRGEYGFIPDVRVRPAGLSIPRAARLASALRRRFGNAVEFSDDAKSRVYVGKAAKIPFAGLAETQGKGGNAFVNLDASSSDAALFDVAAHEIGHLLGTVSHFGEGLAFLAYTAGSAAITLNEGVLNGSAIANEAYVADEPYAQSVGLTVDAAASNCNVLSGGILYIDNGANGVRNGDIAIGSNGVVRVRSKALIEDVTMNGGTLSAWAGTVNNLTAVNAQEILINGTTLSSANITGGRLYTQYAARLNNVAFRDGAVGSMVSGSIDSNIKVYNATLIVSSAAKVYGLDSDEDATVTVLAGGSLTVSNGDAATNVTLFGGAWHSAQAGATLKNYTVSGVELQVSSGVTLNGATVGESGSTRGTLRFYVGATGSNVVMSGNAFVTMDGAGDVVDGVRLLAGGSGEVRAGATAKNVVVSGMGTARLRIAAATVDGATIDGYNGSTGSAVVNSLGVLKNAQILSSGAVYVSSGASAIGVTANANAQLYIYAGATAQDITVANSNRTFIAGGVAVDKLTVLTGGSLLLSGAVTVNDLRMNGGFISSAAAVTGSINGGRIQGGAKLWIRPGLTVNTLSATGANTMLTTFQGALNDIYASDGATVNVNNAVLSDSLIDSGSILIVSNNGKVSDTDVRSTTLTLANGSAVNVRISGGTVDIQAGGQISGMIASGVTADVASLGRISGLVADSGTVVNLSSGAILHGVDAVSEATVNVFSGASANVLAGNSAAGMVIKAGGSVFAQGGTVHGITANAASAGMLRVSAGASALGGTLDGALFTMVASGSSAYMSGFEFGSGVYAYVRTGALVDATSLVAGAQMHVSDGGRTSDLTVNTGATLTVSGGGSATGVTVYAGATHYAHAGAQLADYKVSGYELLINSGVTLDGAEITGDGISRGTLRFYNGATGGNVVVSGNGFVTVNGSTAVVDGVRILAGGSAEIRESSTVGNAVVSAAGLQFKVYQNATLNGAVINGTDGVAGSAWISGGATANSVTVLESGVLDVKDDAAATAVRISGGNALISGTVDGADVIGAGLLNVKAGATASSVNVYGASAFVSGTANDIFVTGKGTAKGYFRLYAGATLDGGTVSGNALLTADSENTLASGISVLGNGEVNIRNAADAKDLSIVYGRVYVDTSDTRLDTATVGGGKSTYLGIRTGAQAYDITAIAGGNVGVNDGTLANAVISSGGALYLASGAVLNGGTVADGGRTDVLGGARVNGLVAAAAAEVNLSLADANAATAVFDSLADISAAIRIADAELDTVYTLADTGNSGVKLSVNYQGFDTRIGTGEYLNPLYQGRKYTVAADGTTFKVEANDIRSEIRTTEAADLTQSGATINNGDRALLWEDVALGAGSAITFAGANIAGDAWLDLDSTQMASNATLYGAEGNYGGTIRYLVHGAGMLGNFAAGAAAGGTVGGVELVGYNNNYGLTYLGGFGNVTNHVSAIVSSGNTLAKDFYAGALANYAKTGTRTTVGDIDTTIAMRTDATRTTDRVKGNIYGASAVKAGTISTTAATAPLHTAGDVTITLAGGIADNSKFCCFAGGYATGHDDAKLAPVYTVDSVTLAVSGGNWGGAQGGRGIFGGAFASDNTANGSDGVYAKVGDVNITISGGVMGNVYGGGWAQKNAKSEVGDVNITISGGTVTNVFGGGTHSTSGGTTSAGNVTITVSGGTITGAIYAKGQLVGDTVTGDANVIFTGAGDQDCDVFGYSYIGTEGVSEALTFADYTGTFTGAVGGFGAIDIAGNTALTLDTAAGRDVVNTSWKFDFTDRSDVLADTAALVWTDTAFAEHTRVAINFADAGQARAGWSIAEVTDASEAVFSLAVEGTVVAEDLSCGAAIESGDYAGWGFALVDSVLKFTKLA